MPVIRVPATTSNLGPGFDALGVALRLYNEVTVEPAAQFPEDEFFMEAGNLFFQTAGIPEQPFSVSIQGEVPRSSGLGSSVTVRLGILYGLNLIHQRRLTEQKLLELAVQLEGHPDNAVPAFYGGFAVSSAKQRFHCRVSSKLSFVTATFDFGMPTKESRAALPTQIERTHAVVNLQNTALIASAFASKKYEFLKHTSDDYLHQPYRTPALPGFEKTVQEALREGALTAYLSGAGPTIIALTLRQAPAVADAMLRELRMAGHSNVCVRVLTADNRGVRVIR